MKKDENFRTGCYAIPTKQGYDIGFIEGDKDRFGEYLVRFGDDHKPVCNCRLKRSIFLGDRGGIVIPDNRFLLEFTLRNGGFESFCPESGGVIIPSWGVEDLGEISEDFREMI